MSRPALKSPWVVIPTYNERETIGELLERLLSLPLDGLQVVIVDDDSPDGTAAIVQSYAASGRVHLVSTGGRIGFAQSYCRGFDYALEAGADAVVHMDADLSHSPEAVPELLEKLHDADLVIGSRYTHGISIVNWPMRRLFLSLLANWYARMVTGIRLQDLTSGFRAWRRDTMKVTNYRGFKVDGYGFLIAMLWRAHRQAAVIAETPIVFTERSMGVSKMSKKIMFESFWLVLRLRLSEFGIATAGNNKQQEHG